MAQPNPGVATGAPPPKVPVPGNLAGLEVPAAQQDGAQPQVAGQAPRNYREYYLTLGNAPPLERVAGFLAGYRFTDGGGGAVPTPATLRDQTVALEDRQPMPFLCMVPGDGGTGEVMIVHRFVRYLDTPCGDPTGFNDQVLGLLGDILPNQYPVVAIPNTVFHLVEAAPVRVPTLAAMNALLPTWAYPEVALGPFTKQDAETEVVRPRYLQLISDRLAAILIHRRRVNAKTTYQELFGAIQAEGDMEAYSDVLTLLRAACAARGGGGQQNTVPSVVHPFTPVILPPVTAKVHSDLPALVPREEAIAGTTEALVGAIRALTTPRAAGGAAAIAGEEEAKAPKTVADTYRETYRTFLRFINVGSVCWTSNRPYGPAWPTPTRANSIRYLPRNSTRFAWPGDCLRISMRRLSPLH